MGVTQAFRSKESADHIDPCNCQPDCEFALATPTYVLLHNGVSRGLARMAFRDQLPEEIRRRQTKGTGTPFYQHVMRQNLPLLREHLLAGLRRDQSIFVIVWSKGCNGLETCAGRGSSGRSTVGVGFRA
jgi:hypothetical protein